MLPLDSVLLGSVLVIDAAALMLCAGIALLTLALLRSRRAALQVSAAARLAFALVVGAALLQCLSGEMLLFLSAGAVLGYALLALGLAEPRCLTPNHAIAAEALLVAGDLALLELAMLLGKSGAPLTFAGAGSALAKLRGDALAAFCLVLGFGSRVGLFALCLPAGRASRAQLALLPGWLLLAVCATAGAVRLSCAGDFAASCAAPLGTVLWWVPALALIAWLLPLWTPGLIRLLADLGRMLERLRNSTLHNLNTVIAAGKSASGSALRAESLLTRWPLALAAGILVALALVAGLATADAPRHGATEQHAEER